MSFYDNFSPFKFRDRSNHNSFVNDLRKELENDRKMFEGNFGNFFSPSHTSRRGDLRSRMGQDFFKNFDGPQPGSSTSSAASSSSSESPGVGERVIPIHVVTGDDEDTCKSTSRPASSASNQTTHEGGANRNADNQKSYSTQRNNTTEMPRVKEISRGQRAQSAPPASDVKMTECGGGQSKKNSAFRNIPIQVESGQNVGRSQQHQYQQQSSSSSKANQSSSSGNSGSEGNRSSDQESKPTPPKKPTLILDPLAKISAVEEQVKELAEKVNLFDKSTSNHKEYLYLDEMLTRCLIQLDDVEVEGRDDVRKARRECIKAIQKCIADLEVKALGESKVSSQDQNSAPSDGSTTVANDIKDESMADVQEIPHVAVEENPEERANFVEQGQNAGDQGEGDAERSTKEKESTMAMDESLSEGKVGKKEKLNPASVKPDSANTDKTDKVGESQGVTQESERMETA